MVPFYALILSHFMRRETQKVTPVWIFCHHKSRPFKMYNNFKDKIKTRHIYQLYLRCGGVGVSQRRVSHGSKKIRQKETGAQIRGDIQQHPCQKSTFASETSSERVSANFFFYLFILISSTGLSKWGARTHLRTTFHFTRRENSL